MRRSVSQLSQLHCCHGSKDLYEPRKALFFCMPGHATCDNPNPKGRSRLLKVWGSTWREVPMRLVWNSAAINSTTAIPCQRHEGFQQRKRVVVVMWCGSRRDLCVFQITGTHVGTVPKFTCGESYLPGVKMVQ